MASKIQHKRIPLVLNKNYKRDGLKSYVYLLTKYGIGPTKPGPFFVGKRMHHQGKFGSVMKRIGGKTTVQEHVLMKRKHHHHSGSGSGTGTGSGSGTGSGTGTGSGSGSGTVPSSGSGSGSGTGTGTGTGTGGGSGSTPSETGSVEASDIQNDSEYLCPVSIGTPAQTLMLDFDTGSADLWVWSTGLPSNTISQYGSSHHIFDSSKSSTFKTSSGSTWQIQYGDGSTSSGNVGTDNVTIGGITITNQAVELAQQISDQFAQGAGDGLLGLAFGNINTVKPTAVKTPVENMIAESEIPKNAELFTAHLSSYRDANDSDGQSFYTFGFIDQTILTANNATASSIHYAPVDNSQGFWSFSSTQASINGTSIPLSGNTAIADTGTTLALVSDTVVDAIYKAIPGAKYDDSQQGYLFPSSTTAAQLPTVQFDVGGQLFTVQKEDLAFADAGNGMVYGGIQSRGDMTFDILGDTFLKSIYAIFDIGNTRFGAVQRTSNTDPATSTPGSTSGTGTGSGSGSGSGTGTTGAN